MKLELKHLAGYLPYGLKWTLQEMKTFEMQGITLTTLYTKEGAVLKWEKHPDLPQALFPILRPISDLAKEIEVNGEKINFPKIFFPIDEFLIAFGYTSQGESESILKYSKIENLCFDIYFWQKLYEFHFDIHGLIEKGLAISIRDVKEAGI